MTTMITEVYEALIDAGAKPDKATAAAQAIVDKETLATKEDLLKVEASMKEETDRVRFELKEEITALDKKIDRVHAELKEEIAGVRSDLLKLENKVDALALKLTVRLGGMLVIAVGAMAALVKILRPPHIHIFQILS